MRISTSSIGSAASPLDSSRRRELSTSFVFRGNSLLRGLSREVKRWFRRHFSPGHRPGVAVTRPRRERAALGERDRPPDLRPARVQAQPDRCAEHAGLRVPGRFQLGPQHQTRLGRGLAPGQFDHLGVRAAPSVRFHDGTPFTADDVVFSLRRALSPESSSPLDCGLSRRSRRRATTSSGYGACFRTRYCRKRSSISASCPRAGRSNMGRSRWHPTPTPRSLTSRTTLTAPARSCWKRTSLAPARRWSETPTGGDWPRTRTTLIGSSSPRSPIRGSAWPPCCG